MGIKAVIFKEGLSKHLFNLNAGVFAKAMLLVGLAGAISWALAVGLDKYAISPIFCDNYSVMTACANSSIISGNVALVLVAIMMVPLLAAFFIKRSFLTVVASVIIFWNTIGWTTGPWYWSLALTILSFMAVYAVLIWLNRLRSDLPAIFLATLFVVLARVVLTL